MMKIFGMLKLKMPLIAITRLKVAVGYVLIAMVMSTLFSLILYVGVLLNIQESFQRAESRLGVGLSTSIFTPLNQDYPLSLFEEELLNTQKQVVRYLVTMNLILLISSSVVSYFLAGETLLPLSELLSRQRQFIADASHELRTPLTSLKTALQISLRNTSFSKEMKQILESNLADVVRLDSLIDRLLVLANQESKEPIKRQVDISVLATEAVDTVARQAQERSITIIVKAPSKQVYLDPDAIRELLHILLDNAVKYSNPNGVIKLIVSANIRRTKITVSDTGIGIAAQDIPRIFDRFYRGSEARQSAGTSGFGIGLAIVQQIVTRHEGVISVTSRVGKGTQFVVRLPA